MDLKEYNNLKKITFPYTTKNGYTIKSLDIHCINCEHELSEIRGIIKEYDGYIEIICLSFCDNCNSMCELWPIRINENGECFIYNENNEYVMCDEKYWLNKNDLSDAFGFIIICFGLLSAILLLMSVLIIL